MVGNYCRIMAASRRTSQAVMMKSSALDVAHYDYLQPMISLLLGILLLLLLLLLDGLYKNCNQFI